ncbi:MAG: 23S rRNA-/tRNA-specific pseudouridylate synthase [Cognaticolwellia sp.]|jgi:23S rRNA-/tRNA-specific pseudouridylate synthase
MHAPTISYQDRYFLVVDKPAGLPTQSPKGGGDNLYDALREEHKYVGLHHRLDTPVSGLVLFTLHKSVNASIAAGFREHTIKRAYRALVLGNLSAAGTWDQDLEGKIAITHFAPSAPQAKVPEHYTTARVPGRTTILDIHLETGRTHQIRRHAADAGHPILGDRRYGGVAGRLAGDICLRAVALKFWHPRQEEWVQVEAPTA